MTLLRERERMGGGKEKGRRREKRGRERGGKGWGVSRPAENTKKTTKKKI